MKTQFLAGIGTYLVLAAGCANPGADYPKLLTDLESGSTQARCNAALVLGRNYLCETSEHDRPSVKTVVAKLTDRLNDPEAEVRGCAAQGLSYIGPQASDAAPTLIDMVKRRDKAMGSAVVALGRMGPAATEATTELLETARDDDHYMRHHSLQALALISPKDARTLDALKKGLKDDVASVRVEAAYSLGLLGTGATSAIPALRESSNDEDRNVADAAKAAIQRIQEHER